MPGIAGLISSRPAEECNRLAKQMVGSMLHEKFYTSGTYSVPHLGFYGGWVAHEGSFADCQPIVGERGDVALVFSGECFSDPESLARQGQSGYGFKANSAEWLVRRYEERGEPFFAELNGLFSGLLIDERRRTAFLFNDRYGLERVYYHERPDEFLFASEAKALLRVRPELRDFDDRALAQMLAFGCTLDWRALFRDIRILPGGSLWSFEGRTPTKRTYFLPASWEAEPAPTLASYEILFEETMRRTVPRYFEPKCAIGISLTGGLDTRMLMACQARETGYPVSYTFGGTEGETLDVRLAARVAAAAGLPHHILRIGPDFFSGFGSLADRTVYITDGSLGVYGAHEVYLNRQARALAPVRLTGNFGSEILRAMTTLKPLGLSLDLVEPDLARRVSEERASLMKPDGQPASFAAFQEIPWSLFGGWRAAQSQLVTRTPYLDNELVRLALRSPRALTRSADPALCLVRRSGGGLERIPTDSGRIPDRPGLPSALGSLCRRASFKLDYWCNEGFRGWPSVLNFPASCLGRPFGLLGLHRYLRYREWSRRELLAYVREQLGHARTQGAGFWNRHFLNRLVETHTSWRCNHTREINAILTIETISRLLLGHAPDGSR